MLNWQLRVKRAIDVIAAASGLLLLSPLLAVLAVLIRCTMGRPVIFSQLRPGRGGAPFRMYKFRTMTDQCDDSGQLLPDRERLTRCGQFLRSSSLDELPELFNVLAGQMSLVGPRPLLMEYLPQYTAEEARRHDVQPGLTGWAQVSGRNALTWEEKFRLDVWYVDHWSLWLDLRILLMTVRTVLRREGVNASAHVSMPKLQRHGTASCETPTNS